jgi:transmembrane sensor
VGEQRTVRLPDGSVVNLNTRSQVLVHFTAAAREVELQDGEALFSVEPDPSRAFSVRTATATIRAIGTQFNVYAAPEKTTVSVLEGAIQVAPLSAPTSGNFLKAGEQAKVERRSLATRKSPDAQSVLAWRERRLIFENASLAEVMAEFNRYSTLQMQAEGDLGRTRHLTGVFSADKPQSLIHYLQQDRRLEVITDGDLVKVRAR